jgi:hypothetical protein
MDYGGRKAHRKTLYKIISRGSNKFNRLSQKPKSINPLMNRSGQVSRSQRNFTNAAASRTRIRTYARQQNIICNQMKINLSL